ncbi:MAG TPA: beta-xylosidase [Blastocatellia bacterium]|nr:beta-xylosidase [Blastocatellia bacterium]HMX26792.1 beta-xylosidase [Blastocatellia bacterium]HMY73913.1 beta-xylosidase [Blastocatellia bacterium]HMZ17643.1 beta-xylosidase [Blastocatellia bacterium]HNG29308.1 beta-xylosidase [Blastocatellia bacterium]
MRGKALTICLMLALLPSLLMAQEPVLIQVDAEAKIGAYKPIYAYFGYDEPNYTYMKHGQKLVGELARLSQVPVHIRAHSLFVTGDGKAALKWGSTNVYTLDANGNVVYDWKIVDQIFDTYVKAGTKPFVEIGFMPEALSIKPQPYKHNWKPGDPYNDIYLGWAYPPKDYAKWGELVRQLVLHSVERYSKGEALTWYWELWNEPDISYWKGTPEEYNKLYDYTAEAVKKALPGAKVGGPATTGPLSEKAAGYLKQFLEHCARGQNAVTGKTGAPLDFITYHAKGRPVVVAGHAQMGIAKNLGDVAKGMEIVASFPQFRNLPIILSESDPEGCAACSARVYPQNTYRNGTIYPTYTAVALSNIFKLADKTKTNIEGMLTWAFEFEDQPWFDGFRSLATNGVDKPVLNVFRMAGLMRGDRIKTASSGAVELDAILKGGVKGKPDVNAMATRGEREIAVMVWNYHDDDLPAADAPVTLTLSGVPATAKRVLVRHYRIDQTHSNSWTEWKKLGSPQNPTPEQYAQLEAAGQLELLTSPEWVKSAGGKVELKFALPRLAVSLVQVSW